LARLRSVLYGPNSGGNPHDQREIARRIERGQAVPDARLAAKALAFARFRTATNLVSALFLLLWTGVWAWRLTHGSSAEIGNALAAAGCLLVSGLFFWQAVRCRRGAKATAEAHRAD
jgi:hypothetical protein